MEAIKFYTLDEVKDKHIGEVGTPHRDKYEAELQSFLIGEAIKKARITFFEIQACFELMRYFLFRFCFSIAFTTVRR